MEIKEEIINEFHRKLKETELSEKLIDDVIEFCNHPDSATSKEMQKIIESNLNGDKA